MHSGDDDRMIMSMVPAQEPAAHEQDYDVFDDAQIAVFEREEAYEAQYHPWNSTSADETVAQLEKYLGRFKKFWSYLAESYAPFTALLQLSFKMSTLLRREMQEMTMSATWRRLRILMR